MQRVVGFALALSLIAGGSAMAASSTTATGIVSALDTKACTVTFVDKTVYQFGTRCDFSKLKVGEKLAIMWKPKGNERLAVQVFVAK